MTRVTIDSCARHPEAWRRGPALNPDERAFGLRRRVVTTSLGRVIVRAGEVTGDTALVLLHGAAGSWTTWTPLLQAAERRGETLTNVVAIDMPGWGESRAPAIPFDIAQLSRAVGEIALSLGYARWIVVGHSLGGVVALDIAARTPARTEAVLLVSPSGPAVLDAIRRPLRGGIALPRFAGMLVIMRALAALGPVGRRLPGLLNRIGLLRPLSAPLFDDPPHVHGTVIDALAKELRPRAFTDAARAAVGYDETIWRSIACPVRSIRGERDVFVGDSDGVGFARLIRDFDQVTLPAAGHFAAIEQPYSVRRALHALLRGLPRYQVSRPPASALDRSRRDR